MRNIIGFSIVIIKIAIGFSLRKHDIVRFLALNEDFGLGYLSVIMSIFSQFCEKMVK